jgi:hypothetical protein
MIKKVKPSYTEMVQLMDANHQLKNILQMNVKFKAEDHKIDFEPKFTNNVNQGSPRMKIWHCYTWKFKYCQILQITYYNRVKQPYQKNNT